jgi:hypothetical protein
MGNENTKGDTKAKHILIVREIVVTWGGRLLRDAVHCIESSSVLHPTPVKESCNSPSGAEQLRPFLVRLRYIAGLLLPEIPRHDDRYGIDSHEVFPFVGFLWSFATCHLKSRGADELVNIQ